MNIKYWPDKAHMMYTSIMLSCHLPYYIFRNNNYDVLCSAIVYVTTHNTSLFHCKPRIHTPDGSKHSNTIRYVTIHAKKLKPLIRTWLQLVYGRTWEVDIICQTYVLDAIVLTLTRYKLANFEFTCAHTNSKQRL